MRHDPAVHPAHESGIVVVAEEPPFGERDGLAVRGREIGLRAQPVGLVDEIRERPPGGLVVGVGADDVDDVVARIAVRPRDGVPAPGGREIETETRAAHAAHDRDDAPPIRAPRGRVGLAAARVLLPVHLPAEDDDRIPGAVGGEALRERPVMGVEGAGRAAPQQRGQHGDRRAGLVRGHHRDVHHQHPPRVGGLPPGPRRDHLLRPLDVPPVVPRQIGAADRHRRAEPLPELLDPADALRAGTEERAQRNVFRRFHRQPVTPLFGGRRGRRSAQRRHQRRRGQNGQG